MTIKDFAKWNTRVSIVYAVGVWTMIGSYAYYSYTGTGKKPASTLVGEEKQKEPEKTNQVIHETAHTKTIIIYKEDFVPYTTRIYNFIKSFSGEPGKGDNGK
ncbi:small integral membrane protein 26-like [Diretmus argenteus]